MIVEYADGRREVIEVPVEYEPGAVVAVTHRRDGGVVVQRCTPAIVFVATGTLTHANTGDFNADVFRQFFTHIKTESGAPYMLRFELTFNDDTTTTTDVSEIYSSWTKFSIDFPGSYGLKTLKIYCMSNFGYVYLDDMGINYNNEYDYEYVDWDFEFPLISEFTYSGRSERSGAAAMAGSYGWRFYPA